MNTNRYIVKRYEGTDVVSVTNITFGVINQFSTDEQVEFIGPFSMERAKEYAKFKNSQT